MGTRAHRRRLPKAELHLHMEGAIEPATVVALAARYGDTVSEADVISRYAPGDFAAFIEAYKWVTSYLRAPADYAFVATRLAEQLLAHNVVYAEVTLSVGVMLLRKQDVAANFRAIRQAAAAFEPRGLRLQWIFDAVRQFGPAPALEVARIAAQLHGQGVVAFGMGGDELAVSTAQFAPVYGKFASRKRSACAASDPCRRNRRPRIGAQGHHPPRRRADRPWHRRGARSRRHPPAHRSLHTARNLPHQ